MEMGGCPLCGHAVSRLIANGHKYRLVRCGHCGLAFQDPQPRLDVMRQYYDHLYDNRAAAEHTDQRRREVFLDFFTRIEPTGFRRLLDVGCGTGNFLGLASERGWEPYGVELAAEAAETARRTGATVHESLADFPDGLFDVVTLWNVLDYFPRPLDEVREVHRVLAPGGRIFVRTPNETYLLAAHRLSRLLGRPALLESAYFFQSTTWRAATMRLLLLCAGFTDVTCWNSPVSNGDPYRFHTARVDRLIGLGKRGIYGLAQAAYTASAGRLVVGSSFSVLARKPG